MSAIHHPLQHVHASSHDEPRFFDALHLSLDGLVRDQGSDGPEFVRACGKHGRVSLPSSDAAGLRGWTCRECVSATESPEERVRFELLRARRLFGIGGR